jgi:hypothetical protein
MTVFTWVFMDLHKFVNIKIRTYGDNEKDTNMAQRTKQSSGQRTVSATNTAEIHMLNTIANNKKCR